MNVNAKGLVTGDQNVYTQVKLMAVNQQWVGNVLADDGRLVHVHIIDIVNEVDTFALRGVRRLQDPHIFLVFRLLKSLVMVVEIAEFFG